MQPEIQAEVALLGAVIRDGRAWPNVADKVKPGDFVRPEHGRIWSAVASLADNGHACDVIAVADALEKAGRLTEVGGFERLRDLDVTAPSADNAGHYARIVASAAMRRRLAQAGKRIADMASASDSDVSDRGLLDAAAKELDSVGDASAKGGGFQGIDDLLRGFVDEVDRAFHGGGLRGISTGLSRLDDVTNGLQAPDLIVIGARPSMGKTALGVGLSLAAAQAGHGVAVFSMEMGAEQIAGRAVCHAAGLAYSRTVTGKLGDEDWPRLTSGVHATSGLPIYVDDTPALTPADLRARVRRLQRELARDGRKLGLIVADYLQLMRAPDSENRVNEIAAVSRSLKAMAKEFGVPVVALAQLSRGLENRPEKRPQLADLRDSGQIEQDADMVWFLYRDEVYYDDSPDKGTAEIIIAKQRNGPTTTVRTAFLAESMRFVDLAPDYESERAHRPQSVGYVYE